YPSMFEPIHGSAPDIAGKQISNPLASVWSVSQMLDYFGYEDWGKKILDVVEDIMVEGVSVTPDMGGKAKTSEVGDAVVKALDRYKK
ncbi:MAG: tartrate dehydrogenase, partial [Fusobacteriaceae bacterium]|nr:tartrate dehydrogenase [Fusobacteriaceae bacterium]